jgi:hypothetical protein
MACALRESAQVVQLDREEELWHARKNGRPHRFASGKWRVREFKPDDHRADFIS